MQEQLPRSQGWQGPDHIHVSSAIAPALLYLLHPCKSWIPAVHAGMTVKDCVLLYSVRWQIEWLFKLWKSHGKLRHSNTANPWRILCEVYAKLLAVMVQHWIVLTGLWDIPERSLVKGGQMIREQSARLAVCFNEVKALARLLRELA